MGCLLRVGWVVFGMWSDLVVVLLVWFDCFWFGGVWVGWLFLWSVVCFVFLFVLVVWWCVPRVVLFGWLVGVVSVIVFLCWRVSFTLPW